MARSETIKLLIGESKNLRFFVFVFWAADGSFATKMNVITF